MPTTASTTTASRSKTRLVVTSLEDSAGMGVARATGGRLRFLTAGLYSPIMARFLDRSAAHRPHEACDVQLNWRRALRRRNLLRQSGGSDPALPSRLPSRLRTIPWGMPPPRLKPAPN